MSPRPAASWSDRAAALDCPVCTRRGTVHFYSATSVPVTCASVFANREQALAVPRADVHLVACADCGFVFNPVFEQSLGQIGAQYESSQAASAHFTQFARTLARNWVERYGLTNKTVLEAGCGDGSFLQLLIEAGVHSAVGIDPYAQPSQSQAIRKIADVFDERHHDVRADAFVCRHTLEHIKDVRAFLSHVRRWAAGGSRVVLFEVPDGERVFAERAFWDVYYEHCNYFTARTLRLAFELAGFEVLRLERAYGDQYLLLEARVRTDVAAQAGDSEEALDLCRRFGSEVREGIARCERRLADLASAESPLIMWQAASKSVGFLSAIRNSDCIVAAIDLSAERHGKFLPGSGLEIYAPAELKRLQPRHIVLMNPVYLTEVTSQVRSLGLEATRVHGVNELLRLE